MKINLNIYDNDLGIDMKFVYDSLKEVKMYHIEAVVNEAISIKKQKDKKAEEAKTKAEAPFVPSSLDPFSNE